MIMIIAESIHYTRPDRSPSPKGTAPKSDEILGLLYDRMTALPVLMMFRSMDKLPA